MPYLRDRGITYVEAKEDAQKKWTDDIYADFEKTLLPLGNAWRVKIKQHADGTTTRRALSYIGGSPRYREICDQVEKEGYAGFELRQTTDA